MNTTHGQQKERWHEALCQPLNRTVTWNEPRWAMEATSRSTHGQITDLLADDLACQELSVLKDGERIIALIKNDHLTEGLRLIAQASDLLNQMMQTPGNSLDVSHNVQTYVPSHTPATRYWISDQPDRLPDLGALEQVMPPNTWKITPLSADSVSWAMDGLHLGNELRTNENISRLGPPFTERLTRHFSALQQRQANHGLHTTLNNARLQVIMHDPADYSIDGLRPQAHLLSMMWLRDRDLTTLIVALAEYTRRN